MSFQTGQYKISTMAEYASVNKIPRGSHEGKICGPTWADIPRGKLYNITIYNYYISIYINT